MTGKGCTSIGMAWKQRAEHTLRRKKPISSAAPLVAQLWERLQSQTLSPAYSLGFGTQLPLQSSGF